MRPHEADDIIIYLADILDRYCKNESKSKSSSQNKNRKLFII